MKNILTSLLLLFSITCLGQQADISTQNKTDSLKVIVGQAGSSKWAYNKDLSKDKLTIAKYLADSTVLNGYIDNKFPLTGGTLSGTTNNGFIGFHPQTTAMVTPVDGLKLYDSLGFVLLRSDGYRRMLSFSGLNSNVKYNFPVGTTNDTVTTNTAPQTLTMKSISGTANSITNILDASLSSNVDLINTSKTFTANKFFALGTDMRFFNTSDQTTNYTRARMFWNSNVFTIGTEYGGSGTQPTMAIGVASTTAITPNRLINIQTNGFPFFSYTYGGTGAVSNGQGVMDIGGGNSFMSSSGNQTALSITPSIIQTVTGGYKGIFISPFENTLGSGIKLLIDAGTNTAASGSGTHTSKFAVDNNGKIILSATNTTTGTTGAQTINKPSGKVNFAAAATSLIVTNSLVTTTSIVHLQVEGTDATAKTATVTLASGSFTITLNAAATAETKVSFVVFN